MWCLISPDGQTSHYLMPGKVHTVSRKDGEIILQHKSVSRKHAFLEVKSPVTAGVHVWDDSSKYGTFVNEGITSEERILQKTKVTLKDGARVRFGVENNPWLLSREALCVCAHMLNTTERNKIKSVISEFRGTVVDKWTGSPSHLTTNFVRLTYEVMCALVSGKPIVKPMFWENYKLVMNGKGTSLDPSKFVPPVRDERLTERGTLCLPNPARKVLFKDKLFIFPNSQCFNVYKGLVESAGGKAGKLSDCNMSLEDYCKPHVVVVSSENEETSFYNKVMSKVIDKNLRVIPEEDIGLAIWNVSTSQYCNPRYSANDFLRQNDIPRSEQNTGLIIAMNTEDVEAASTRGEGTDLVIPPSHNEICSSSGLAMSERTTQPKTEPDALPGTSRKRPRENDAVIKNKKSVESKASSTLIKNEPRDNEEEDMFADGSPDRHAPAMTIKSKKEEKQNSLNDDAFLFPSPPKKKKPKQSVEDNDMFALIEEPLSDQITQNRDDDEFERTLNSINKTTAQNESRDLFETQDSTSATSGKRKERDPDHEDPPTKRPPRDVTNVSQEKSSSFQKIEFIRVKKELIQDSESHVDTELASRVAAEVIVTSLRRKHGAIQNGTTRNNFNSGAPNFKKFKKSGAAALPRLYSTTVVMEERNKNAANQSGDEDDPMRADSPALRHRNDSESDGEFALPSYSQV